MSVVRFGCVEEQGAFVNVSFLSWSNISIGFELPGHVFYAFTHLGLFPLRYEGANAIYPYWKERRIEHGGHQIYTNPQCKFSVINYCHLTDP